MNKAEYCKQWYLQNKDKIAEKRRTNKDEINAKRRAFRLINRDKINEKNREKHTCECGRTVNKYNLHAHMKTAYHLKRVKTPLIINLNK